MLPGLGYGKIYGDRLRGFRAGGEYGIMWAGAGTSERAGSSPLSRMRVIAGKAKGQSLKAPKGLRTRPTTQLVRGAIFSILESVTGDWSRVLDLYAGSGALGIEALSRGAGWADFVEQEPRCSQLIKRNLEATGLAAQARVYCCQVAKALSFLSGEYNIILMDPPYSDSSMDTPLEKLAASSLVGANSTIVVPHSCHLPLSSSYGRLQLIKQRRHGDTCISVYREGH